ncbi:hypothetical protein PCE1_001467 [Barthelona sp. PCE]
MFLFPAPYWSFTSIALFVWAVVMRFATKCYCCYIWHKFASLLTGIGFFLTCVLGVFSLVIGATHGLDTDDVSVQFFTAGMCFLSMIFYRKPIKNLEKQLKKRKEKNKLETDKAELADEVKSLNDNSVVQVAI